MTHARLVSAALLALGSFGCSDGAAPKKVAEVRDPPNYPCEQSLSCKRFGWCQEVAGECQAGSDEHCRNSELCKKSGLCSQEGAKCVAREGDCGASDWCKEYDYCTAREGVCK